MSRQGARGPKGSSVVVVGGGVMGLWTARALMRRGHAVRLVDAWGPGHARASSSGESRVIRCGYGGAGLYAAWAWRSLRAWKSWERSIGERIFVPAGVLWLVAGNEPYAEASLATLSGMGIPVERLSRRELESRFPQFSSRGVKWALLEPEGGILLARRACQLLASELDASGAALSVDEVRPGAARGGLLRDVQGASGGRLMADAFVFACGPWLPRIFPELLRRKLEVTRKEVFFFGVPPGESRFQAPGCPVWLELGTGCYGIPGVDGRGFKIHPDVPGRVVDPTTQDRRPTRKLLDLARACLDRRFPALAGAPVLETRVCQYTSTADDHLVFDRHPELENVWIVGAGSGHAFKHGPVIGEVVADGLEGRRRPEDLEPLRLAHLPEGRHF